MYNFFVPHHFNFFAPLKKYRRQSVFESRLQNQWNSPRTFKLNLIKLLFTFGTKTNNTKSRFRISFNFHFCGKCRKMFTSSIALCCRCSDGCGIDEQIFKILKICIHTKVKGVPPYVNLVY